jgi:tetrahydromethanopterin S-methyltransferase subunit C
MGTYYIPRNYKGETRLLYIFSIKSLITTTIGALIGLAFYFIFKVIGIKIAGIIALIICALLGYVVGAFKIPTIVGIPVTKKIGGESISEIIIRYIKFKKSRKIYSYTKEDK